VSIHNYVIASNTMRVTTRRPVDNGSFSIKAELDVFDHMQQVGEERHFFEGRTSNQGP